MVDNQTQFPALVVACADCKECIANINILFDLVGLWSAIENLKNFFQFGVIISADSKVLHMITGVSSNAAKFP